MSTLSRCTREERLTVGLRHDEMRKRNRALVIAAVRRAGQCSRTEIARLTGLSHSTISAIAADLIEEGFLREVRQEEAARPRRGRPQVAIGLNPDAAAVACLHLSFNSLTAVLVDYRGRVVETHKRHLETLTMGRQDLLDAAVAAVRAIAPRGRLHSIAFAVQGIADAGGREMQWSPITPRSNVPFALALEEAFGVPVTVQNDCNMIAVALRWANPERYRDNFVAILLSHGIGMGLMLNGRLFTGTHSSAGEFGHMIHTPGGALCRCGRHGCIEAYAGDYAIWRRAHGGSAEEKPISEIDACEFNRLAEAARSGEGPEREAFREAAHAIGYGIGSLFALIDPAPVAMVGPGTAAFDILEPEIRAALARTAGGQNQDAITFESWADEVSLILRGSAMTALTKLDQEVFAPGLVDSEAEGGKTGSIPA